MTEHWSMEFAPPGEPIPGKTYRADGWGYYDFPKMTSPLWERLLTIIGPDNYVALTEASYHAVDVVWKRGQLLISPTGQENMLGWASSGNDN